MRLKEILQKLVSNQENILLNDGVRDWEPGNLLANLSEPRLNIKAHFQNGLYIAELDSRGYLRSVIYRIKMVESC